MGHTGFRGVMIGLTTVPAGEMRVRCRGDRVLRVKASFGFPVMLRSLFIMVRGIVMVPCGRMFARHDCSPELRIYQNAGKDGRTDPSFPNQRHE